VQATLPVLPPGQDTVRIAIVPVVGDLELPQGSATSPVQDLVGSHTVDPQAYTTTTALTTRPPLVAFVGVLVVETASIQGLMSDSAACAAIGRGLSRASGLRSARVQVSSFTGQPDANLGSFSYRLLVKELHEVAVAASTLRDLSTSELRAFVGIELEAVGKESYAVAVISNHEAMTTTTAGTMPPSLAQVDDQGALANVGIIVVACLVFLGCCCILFVACVLQSALHQSAKVRRKQKKVFPIHPTDVVGFPENNLPDSHNGALKLKAIWVQPTGQLPEETLQPPRGPKCSTRLAPSEVHVRKNGHEEELHLPSDAAQQQRQQFQTPRATGRPRPAPSPLLCQSEMQDEHTEFVDSSEAMLHRPVLPPPHVPPPTCAPLSLCAGSGDQGSVAKENRPDSAGAGSSSLFSVVPFASTLQIDEELRTGHRRSAVAGSGLGASGGTMSMTVAPNSSSVNSPTLPCSLASAASVVPGVPGHQPFRQSAQPRGTCDIHRLAELQQLPGNMNTTNSRRCRERKLQLRRPAYAASALEHHHHQPTSAISSQGDWQEFPDRQAG